MVVAIKIAYLFICAWFISYSVKEYRAIKNVCYLLSAVCVGVSAAFLFYTFVCDLIYI